MMRLFGNDIRPLAAYKRWRHSRGFGIHSPYGYRMVTEVFNPRDVSFYGYVDIKHSFTGEEFSAKDYRRACLLLRLVNFLQPKKVYLPAGAKTCYREAIKNANSRIEIISDLRRANDCELWLVNGNDVGVNEVSKHLTIPGNSIGMLNPSVEIYRRVTDTLDEGIIFRSPESIIIIHRPHTALVEYSIKL